MFCPNCKKFYTPDKPPHGRIWGEPWQNEQHVTGICSDKCYDESVSGHRPEYTYDAKGRRFENGARKPFADPPEVVVCDTCKQEMKEAKSCTNQFVKIGGKWHLRDNTYYDDNERCHDCSIMNGFPNYHHPGCDMERCPICGGQAISCDCAYDNVMVHIDACPACEAPGAEHLPDAEGNFVCQTEDCGMVVEVTTD